MWLVLAMIAPTAIEKLDEHFLPERIGLISMVLYGKHFGYCPIYDSLETINKYFPEIDSSRIVKLPIRVIGDDDGDKEPA